MSILKREDGGTWTDEDTAWAWCRLASLVNQGADCRILRNRFGLAMQGKYQLTQEDVDDALDAIYMGA